MSDEKQEILNNVTNRWNNCRIKGTSQDPYIWFNELYNLNPKFKRIKAKYKKYEDRLKAHAFDVLPEQYKPVRVSCNVNISNMKFEYVKKEIRCFWSTHLKGRKT